MGGGGTDGISFFGRGDANGVKGGMDETSYLGGGGGGGGCEGITAVTT